MRVPMEINFKLFKQDKFNRDEFGSRVVYYKKYFLINELRSLGLKLTGKTGEKFSNQEHLPEWFLYPESLIKQIIIEFTDFEEETVINEAINKYLSSFEKRHPTITVYEIFQISLPQKILLGMNFFINFTYNSEHSFEQVDFIESLKSIGFSERDTVFDWKKSESQRLLQLIKNSDLSETIQLSEGVYEKQPEQQKITKEIAEIKSANKQEVEKQAEKTFAKVQTLMEQLDQKLAEVALELVQQHSPNEAMIKSYQVIEDQIKQLKEVLPKILVKFKNLSHKAQEFILLEDKMNKLEKQSYTLKETLKKSQLPVSESEDKSLTDSNQVDGLNQKVEYLEIQNFRLKQKTKQLEVKIISEKRQRDKRIRQLKMDQSKLQQENQLLQEKLMLQEEQPIDSPESLFNSGRIRSVDKYKGSHKMSVKEYKNMIRTINYLEYTWSIYQKYTEKLDTKTSDVDLKIIMKKIKKEKIQQFVYNHTLNDITPRVTIKKVPLRGKAIVVISNKDFRLCCMMEEQYHLMQTDRKSVV